MAKSPKAQVVKPTTSTKSGTSAPAQTPSAPVRPTVSRAPALSHEGGAVKFHILLRLARKNLFFKKLRTSLTVLGVVIGIGSVVFLVSFGFGLQNLVNKQVIGSKSINTIDVTTLRSKLLKLDKTSVSTIEGLQSVDEVAKVYTAAGKVKISNAQIDAVVYGTSKSYIDLSALPVSSGQSLDSSKTNQVLINSSLLTAIGLSDPQKAIGQSVNLTFNIAETDKGNKVPIAKDATIIGIVDSGAGAEIYVNQKLFEDAETTAASQLKVLVKDQTAIPKVRDNIGRLGFTTASPLDTLDQINQVFTLLKFVLLGFGGIGMLIAILGMFNTLTISLLERTKEIGLMISLGARQRDVKRLFVVESLLLSVLGGVVGIAGAFMLGTIADLVLNRFAHSRGVTERVSAFVFPPTLLLAVIGLSAVLGLVVVYFPARRASRINPIDALRYE